MYEIENVIIMFEIVKCHMCTYKRPSTANVLCLNIVIIYFSTAASVDTPSTAIYMCVHAICISIHCSVASSVTTPDQMQYLYV